MRRRWNHVVFSSCGGILELRRGFQASSWDGPGKPNLPFELRGKAGGCARITAGPKRPYLGVFPDLIFLSREDRDLRVAFQTPLGCQASFRREGKDSALLSSRDADLLEPTEWPQGNPASSSVWREDPGLLSRTCRKRRTSAREEGGVSGDPRAAAPMGVFSRGTTRISGSLSCGAREVRSPCTWRGGACPGSRVKGGD